MVDSEPIFPNYPCSQIFLKCDISSIPSNSHIRVVQIFLLNFHAYHSQICSNPHKIKWVKKNDI